MFGILAGIVCGITTMVFLWFYGLFPFIASGFYIGCVFFGLVFLYIVRIRS